MLRTLLSLLPLGLAASAQAITCDELQAQIEAKLRAGGLKSVQVVTVDAASSAPGREVGRCERGARKILYRPGTAATARPDAILTECKDGTVSMGGTCGRK